MPLNKNFLGHLRESGISEGAILVVETSPRVIGDQPGASADLLAMLLSAVGPRGTLAVPTCTASEGRPKTTFDPLLSPSEMGPFSEFFRTQTGVRRSHSPTHSLAALGPLSEVLVSGHRSASGRPTPWGEGPFGKGSPWDMLFERDAWWIVLGADVWPESPVVAYVKALYAAQHAGITKSSCFPQFDALALVAELVTTGVVKRTGSDAGHAVWTFRTRRFVDAALTTLHRSPEKLRPTPEFSRWLDMVDRIGREGYTQVGVAKAKITPPVPALRWEGKRLTGIYRDLYTRVVAASYRDQRAAVVLCDLLGISGELVSRVRDIVFAKIGLPPDAIQVACTHSHSTPDTIGAGYEDGDYLDSLVTTIADAICDAFDRQQPVRIGWSRVPIRGLARSRRVRMADGTVFTTRYGVPSTWRVAPDLIAGNGRVDPDLTVVRVETMDGDVLACISNFACHASVALLSPDLSGDFPGEAMHILETVLGAGCVALCTNGAAADVDPTEEMPFWGPRNDQMALHLGRIFAAQVLEALERVEVDELSEIDAERQTVTLELRREWRELLQSEQDRMQQEFASGWVLSSVSRRLLDEGVLATEVQGVRMGDLVLLGMPGEVFVETGTQLKEAGGVLNVAVVELANDDIGYIPTHTALAEGGYEVGRHLWGRITPQGTDILETAARQVLDRLSTARRGSPVPNSEGTFQEGIKTS